MTTTPTNSLSTWQGNTTSGQAEPQKRPVDLAEVLRLFLYVGILAVILLAAIGVGVQWAFGKLGVQIALVLVGVGLLYWLITSTLSRQRQRDMEDITKVIHAMTLHDVTIQRSDDQGEIMRVLAPKMLDIARQTDGNANQRANVMFQGALNMAKQLGTNTPDPMALLGADGADLDFTMDDED